MTAVIQNLKQSINRNVETIMPQEDQKQKFTEALNKYLDALRKNEHKSEEFQKGIFRDFLRTVITDKQINTSERIDLAIYNGRSSDSSVGVVVEYKKLDNKSEMMSLDDLNAKAFREMVAYYLRERIVNHNLEVKKGIVTNGYEFFIIDSNELEKHFYKNKKLVENFKKFERHQLASSKTEFLFDEVVAPAIDKALDKRIRIGYFNINASLKKGTNEFKKSDITRLYRLFSTENLLNEMVFADSNSLNKNFYNELLYIMGLQESKKGGNKIIDRLKAKDRQDASLVENTIEQLDIRGVPENKRFDIAVQLVVVWINRILFLKLLESSLVSFHKSDQDKGASYKFLNYKNLHSFDDINELFFLVMAKQVNERKERIQNKYPNVPYMNSSLFEQTRLELSRDGLPISELKEGKIEVFSKTKLKDENGKKLKGQLDVLDYLFKFLGSYDFTSAVGAKNKKSQDQLINASVLGLIFEKINGYKDGSFFTPGKITMYMAKRAVRQAVLTKANEVLGTNYSDIIQLGMITRDVNFSLDKRKEISDAIDSLKILDPAVGSGHFLVSILNELIAIKASLRVLFDTDGRLLNDVSCTVANDELVIQDVYGDNFSYDANKPGSLRVQKALFEQKKIIIENCLYGVDLNPNSVNICRLRLWIELLKNAYYSENEGELTTLPNIDINIKTGDSLIHRFSLDSSFDMRRTNFKQYVQLVKEYKNTSDKSVKADIDKNIQKIKDEFIGSFVTPEMKAYAEAERRLTKAGEMDLFDNKFDVKKFAELKKKADEARKISEEHRTDPLYSNSLEWRLEFPEVLDEDGNFVGFDIVIANPPYIFSRNKSFDERTKKYYSSHYEVDEYQANTYTLFMELGYKLLKKDGIFAYIVPNNLLTLQKTQKLRNFLLNNSGSLIIINSLDKLFSEASVDNCLIFLKKEKSNYVTVGELKNGDFNTIGTVKKSFFGKTNPVISISMVKYRYAVDIFWKLNSLKTHLSDFATVKIGVKEYEVGKGKPKQTSADKENDIFYSDTKLDNSYRKSLGGKNVGRYTLNWTGKYIKYGDNLAAKRDPKLFIQPRLLVRQIPVASNYAIKAVYTDADYISNQSLMIVTGSKIVSLPTLLGIINSKVMTIWFNMRFDKFQRRTFPRFLVSEFEEFPIPKMNANLENMIANKVKALQEKIKENLNCSAENKEIDELVMTAFELNDTEKEAVRRFEF